MLHQRQPVCFTAVHICLGLICFVLRWLERTSGDEMSKIRVHFSQLLLSNFVIWVASLRCLFGEWNVRRLFDWKKKKKADGAFGGQNLPKEIIEIEIKSTYRHQWNTWQLLNVILVFIVMSSRFTPQLPHLVKPSTGSRASKLLIGSSTSSRSLPLVTDQSVTSAGGQEQLFQPPEQQRNVPAPSLLLRLAAIKTCAKVFFFLPFLKKKA